MNKSFRDRVAKFWIAFAEEEAEIRAMIDNKADSESLVKFVNSILAIAFEDPYFQLGKNNYNKFELVLTPEGDRTKYLQLSYWLETAPPFLSDRWNFYSSKPAHPDSAFDLQMFGLKLSKNEIELYHSIDVERKRFNLEVYAPKMMSLDEGQRYNMFFVMLDQFISEIYTMEYIGSIDFVETEQNVDSVTFDKLKELIDKTIKERDWEKELDPTRRYTAYKMTPTEDKDWSLREDIMIGITSCMPVLNSFYRKESRLFDDLKKDGVVLGFLFYENVNIAKDNVVLTRDEIEDHILDVVESKKIANSIGGATGFHFSYIDFIIYDYEAFTKAAKEVLAKYNFEEVGFSNFVFGATPIIFEQKVAVKP